MSETTHRFEEELQGLRRLRDELRVRLHLGRAEARDRFQALEKDLEHVEGRLKLIRDETREDLEEIREASRLLLEELKHGYQHLRSLL
jgi:hypothetical protein